jgi:hypothetical protein
MQAFSPAPKSTEKFIASASPRKKKFQAQLASPSPQLADSERKVALYPQFLLVFSYHDSIE